LAKRFCFVCHCTVTEIGLAYRASITLAFSFSLKQADWIVDATRDTLTSKKNRKPREQLENGQ